MNRIDQLLQQMIAETSQQVLPTVYSATMLAGLQELQGLTAGIEAQRAFAQQSVPAVPKGWQLVPVEPTPEMLAATSWPGCAEADYAKMISAAPAAPVAQEPVRELIGYACDRRGALIPDRCGDCLCWPAYQDAPPAAEQPATGHELFAELYQILGALGASEAVLDQVLAASQGEPLPHASLLPYAADQPTRAMRALATISRMARNEACREGAPAAGQLCTWDSIADMADAALADAPAAEQPDTVKVPRDVLREALAWLEVNDAGYPTKELRALLAGGAA